MKKSFSFRELFAWLLLVCAVALFSVTIAFAQSPAPKSKTGNTVSVKIIKKENGKTTKIDTTFKADDDEAIQKIIHELDPDADVHVSTFHFKNKPGKQVMTRSSSRNSSGSKHIDLDSLDDEINIAIARAGETMDDAMESMKNIHLDIDGGPDDFNFNFEMPPIPGGHHAYMYKFKKGKGKCKAMAFRFGDQDEDNFKGIDSLDDDNHLIYFGGENEKAPTLEKEITGKDGSKAYVFRLDRPEPPAKAEPSELPLQHFKYYPNPGKGKLNLRFTAPEEGNIQIQVYNAAGDEVYASTYSHFSGDFNSVIDLSSKPKGNYILKISQGEKSLSRQFIVE